MRTPIPPLTYRQMVWKREEEYIYINIFSLFAHFPQNPSVGLSVGDLSTVSTDEGSARVCLSDFSTEADVSPTHSTDMLGKHQQGCYSLDTDVGGATPIARLANESLVAETL